MPQPNTPPDQALLLTIKKVVRDFKSSGLSRSEFRKITPWYKIQATLKELSALSFEENFIAEQFLICNPVFLQTKVTNLEELNQALWIQALSENQEKELIQQKYSLISSASQKDLEILVKNSAFILRTLVKNLSEEELIQFGKKYASGNKEYTTELLSALSFRKKQSVQKVLFALLPSFSPEDKKKLIKKFPPPFTSLKEIGLIMGLAGDNYEALDDERGVHMARQRFLDFMPESSEPLNYHLAEDYKQGSDFYAPIQEHGDLRSIHASWIGHAFSVHLIKDGKDTHLIYVNRGESHDGAAEDEPAVTVFTIPKQKIRNLLISKFVDVLKTHNKTKISAFIMEGLMHYKNTELSQEFDKHYQKVGNCVVGNANITWHFTLAAREMKKNNSSLSQAYKHTKPAYKLMRMKDRAKAFCDLMINPDLNAHRQDALSQIMHKMAAKDTKGRETVPFLINHLYKRAPKKISALLNNLYHHIYDISEAHQNRWINVCQRKLNENNAPITDLPEHRAKKHCNYQRHHQAAFFKPARSSSEIEEKKPEIVYAFK